jgi:hypothetical protein
MSMIIRIGICKECFHDVRLDRENKVDGHQVWECPNCGHPNAESDFWQIWDEVTD